MTVPGHLRSADNFEQRELALGETVEIHKPHAAKSWPEFFIELGTITAGILIALVLEQIVEGARERRHAAEAQHSVRTEIEGNLALLETRRAIEPCVSRRLDEVDGVIRQMAEDGERGEKAIWVGHPTIWSLPESQYRSASQAGHMTLMPVREQAGYAAIYAAFDQYMQAEAIESRAWADLRTLEGRPPKSAVLDWQLRAALQQARTARWTLEISAKAADDEAALLGVKPSHVNLFKMQSACLDLHTPRAEALKLVVEGRDRKTRFDEP